MDICGIVPKGSTLHLPLRCSPALWGYAYLEHIGCDETSFRRIDEYLKLIKARATGHQLTPATWMRNFVHSHRDYKSLGCQGTWLAVGGHCHRSGALHGQARDASTWVCQQLAPSRADFCPFWDPRFQITSSKTTDQSKCLRASSSATQSQTWDFYNQLRKSKSQPSPRRDSVVSDSIAFDLVSLGDRLTSATLRKAFTMKSSIKSETKWFECCFPLVH